ncbi:MAG: Na+/H+ antiporter NhaA, partial [Eggerthellaceae bacterium]
MFISEVQGHQARYRKLIQFTHSSTKAAGAMLVAAVVALVVANSGAYEAFLEFWHTEAGFFFGDAFAGMSLAHVINDVFMAVFFLLVGLEVKYELTVGELTNIRQAILPIMAAVGGVLVPIAFYLAFNAGNPETAHGWGVPTATDIAFALGILALLGNRVPSGVRVFLSTLAVADDIIAI